MREGREGDGEREEGEEKRKREKDREREGRRKERNYHNETCLKFLALFCIRSCLKSH